MTDSRPPQISEHHLRRKAIVYIRQSSDDQVRHNVGSTALQRDLAGVMQGWGWPQESIEVIDADLGVSGSRAGIRQGFNALIERMEADSAGIVAVTDISRLGRNHADLFTFAMTARRCHVLLLHGEQVTDFEDPNSEFTGLILGLNAARENRARAEHARRARRKKAEAGIASTAPPAGYLAQPGGTWCKDPDGRVRDVIQLVFDTYLDRGSCGAVLRHLAQHGIQLPRRRAHGRVTWGPPSRVRIHRILRNPAYAGFYVYGATRSEDGRQAKIPTADQLLIEDHHDPYVPRHQWAEIQTRLSANRRVLRAPLGRGDALLQGLLRCTRHDRRFSTFYPARERRDGTVIRRAVYRCFDLEAVSDPFCSAVRGSTLDQVVERELFRILRPPATDVIDEIHRAAEREYEAIERLRKSKEREAEQAATEKERAYQQADPTHTRVKQRLASQWDEALRHLEEVRTDHRLHSLVPPLTLGDTDRRELGQLLADLPSLWRHPRVTPAERKAVARAVIDMIHVTPEPDAWTIEIEWVGGDRTPFDFLTSTGVRTIVEQAVNDGLSASQIAQLLGDRGAVQRSGPHIGRPYTAASVKTLIRRFGWDRSHKREAYAYIRSRYLDHIPLRKISDELNARRIRQIRGPWTEHRVQGAVHHLMHHPVAGVPQLPPIEPLDPRVIALFDEGLSAREIAAKLCGEGALTRQRRPPTPVTVRMTLRRHGRSPAARRSKTTQPERAAGSSSAKSVSPTAADRPGHANRATPRPKSIRARANPRPPGKTR